MSLWLLGQLCPTIHWDARLVPETVRKVLKDVLLAMSVVCIMSLSSLVRMLRLYREAQTEMFRRPDGLRQMRQAEYNLPLLAAEADGSTSKEAETLPFGRKPYRPSYGSAASTITAPKLSECP